MPPFSAVPCLGETHRLKLSLSPCPVSSFFLPGASNRTRSADDSEHSLKFLHQTIAVGFGEHSRTVLNWVLHTVKKKWYKHYIACICVKGINVTNQDSQLKYDERHRAKERGIKRWKKDRKQGR